MAENTGIISTKLTNRVGKDEIRVLWLGEWGHLIMNTLPRINKIRLEHPNARIIFASYQDDMIYFRDDKGRWTIDEYWGIPWFPVDRGCHECKGQWPDYAQKLQIKIYSGTTRGPLRYWEQNGLLCFSGSDSCRYIIDTTAMTLAEYTIEFKKKPRIAYPLKYIVQEDPMIETENNYCVVYARAKNYSSTLFRSWYDDRWIKFVELLQKEYSGKIYVCGIEAESVKFPWSDRLINFTNMKGLERSTKTLNILAGADFCISDCSGSANFAIQVGAPTFVSGPAGYAEGFEKNKNYFGTHVLYQTCDRDNLTPELRMEGWRKFMSNLTYNLKRDIYEGIVS